MKFKLKVLISIAITCFVPFSALAQLKDTIFVSKLDILEWKQEYKDPILNLSISGKPIKIAGKEFQRGIGTHAPSEVHLFSTSKYISFESLVGLDDAVAPFQGYAKFHVVSDTDTLWSSTEMKTGDSPQMCAISIVNRKNLKLVVTTTDKGTAYAHACWANTFFTKEKSTTTLLDTFRLEDTPLDFTFSSFEPIQKNRNINKKDIVIGGIKFESGVGAHSWCKLQYHANGKIKEFRSYVGPDEIDNWGIGTVEFLVIGDGEILWRSGVMQTHDKPKFCRVDVSGITIVELVLSNGGDNPDFDHAAWADGYFLIETGFIMKKLPPAVENEYLLTPQQTVPQFNGCTFIGCKPNSPIEYFIPISGEAPLTIDVLEIPTNLMYDKQRNIVHGSLPFAGTYSLLVKAQNSKGELLQKINFIVGDTLLFAPPMGWNSWDVFKTDLFQDSIQSQATALVQNNLRQFGYQYITIDDGWQRESIRNADGSISTNAYFPTLSALADSLHSYGLKFGIYTSPAPRTCAENIASFGYEEKDAAFYSSIGVDYVKNDYCYGYLVTDTTISNVRARHINDYKRLGRELKKQPRNIVHLICNYGMNKVWEWAHQADGEVWRTTGDTYDDWWQFSTVTGFSSAGLHRFCGYDSWQDLDFLHFGTILPKRYKRKVRLTPSEQYSMMSLLAIQKSSLILSFDMHYLNPFTLNLITNTEIIAINQDAYPTAGRRVSQQGYWQEVWMNEMSDGSMAVALFNRDDYKAKNVTVRWEDIGLKPGTKARVRDCWRQRDITISDSSYTAEIPSHGCMMLRIYPNQTNDVPSTPSTNITIAPNPLSYVLSVQSEAKNSCIKEILIHNTLGEKLYSQQFSHYFPNLSFNQNIDVSSFPTGMFMLSLKLSNNTYVTKQFCIVR